MCIDADGLAEFIVEHSPVELWDTSIKMTNLYAVDVRRSLREVPSKQKRVKMCASFGFGVQSVDTSGACLNQLEYLLVEAHCLSECPDVRFASRQNMITIIITIIGRITKTSKDCI